MKILALFTADERRQLLSLVPAVTFVALFETLGLASIAPFVALLSNPDAVETHRWLRRLAELLAVDSREQLFFVVGLAMLGFFTVGNAVSALTSWALLRFSWLRNHTLSVRVLEAAVARPYAWFLARHTSDIAQNALSEVQMVVSGVVVAGIQLAARGVSLIAMLMLVFVIDPVMALFVGALFGGLYGGLSLVTQRRQARLGRERLESNRDRFRVATEMLTGIKEVKVAGLERVFLRRYTAPSLAFAEAVAKSQMIGQLPRFALESIAMGGVLIMLLVWLALGRALSDVVPVLGLFAFAGYRVLPGIQVLFSGLSSIRAQGAALDAILHELEDVPPLDEAVSDDDALPFEREVALEQVHFDYGDVRRALVVDVNVRIACGEWVALVGTTGAGKTTLVDLLLGLLEPKSGTLTVDGARVDRASVRRWQAAVGYVPQQTFLVDAPISENIALGVDGRDIDMARVEHAARIAQLHDFVKGELKDGYRTEVGERGVRLSGGQRQRIGIARALYRAPRLLVLDEATSALDLETEARVFAALREALVGVTVVSIAHRLSTTRAFDRVLVLDNGRIVDEGRYEELEVRGAFSRATHAPKAARGAG